jgi:hypothetical protein
MRRRHHPEPVAATMMVRGRLQDGGEGTIEVELLGPARCIVVHIQAEGRYEAIGLDAANVRTLRDALGSLSLELDKWVATPVTLREVEKWKRGEIPRLGPPNPAPRRRK